MKQDKDGDREAGWPLRDRALAERAAFAAPRRWAAGVRLKRGGRPQGWKAWPEELWNGPIMSVYSHETGDWDGSGYGTILETPCVRPGARTLRRDGRGCAGSRSATERLSACTALAPRGRARCAAGLLRHAACCDVERTRQACATLPHQHMGHMPALACRFCTLSVTQHARAALSCPTSAPLSARQRARAVAPGRGRRGGALGGRRGVAARGRGPAAQLRRARDCARQRLRPHHARRGRPAAHRVLAQRARLGQHAGRARPGPQPCFLGTAV